MCRFSGNMDVKVDGKGRLFVPAAFRRALEGDSTLFLRVDTVSKCAKFYPASEWEKLNAQFMSQLNLWNQSDLRLYRQFSAGVEQVDLDASGRILIQRRNLDLLEITSDEKLMKALEEKRISELTSRENLPAIGTFGGLSSSKVNLTKKPQTIDEAYRESIKEFD